MSFTGKSMMTIKPTLSPERKYERFAASVSGDRPRTKEVHEQGLGRHLRNGINGEAARDRPLCEHTSVIVDFAAVSGSSRPMTEVSLLRRIRIATSLAAPK